MTILNGNNISTSINSYSVWLEVHVEGKSEPIMIHPSAFEMLKKSMDKARELSSLDGDTAIKEWETFAKQINSRA